MARDVRKPSCKVLTRCTVVHHHNLPHASCVYKGFINEVNCNWRTSCLRCVHGVNLRWRGVGESERGCFVWSCKYRQLFYGLILLLEIVEALLFIALKAYIQKSKWEALIWADRLDEFRLFEVWNVRNIRCRIRHP